MVPKYLLHQQKIRYFLEPFNKRVIYLRLKDEAPLHPLHMSVSKGLVLEFSSLS